MTAPFRAAGPSATPGTVLRRRYKGKAVLVRMLASGFEHEGEVYRSLTAVAEKVTGAHWNGLAAIAAASSGIGDSPFLRGGSPRGGADDQGQPVRAVQGGRSLFVDAAGGRPCRLIRRARGGCPRRTGRRSRAGT